MENTHDSYKNSWDIDRNKEEPKVDCRSEEMHDLINDLKEETKESDENKVDKYDLKLCLCGGEGKKEEYYRTGGFERYIYWVKCLKCGYETPIYDSEDEAVKRWNSRGKKVKEEKIENAIEESDDIAKVKYCEECEDCGYACKNIDRCVMDSDDEDDEDWGENNCIYPSWEDEMENYKQFEKEEEREYKISKHANLCEELNRLYAAKNQDYGDSTGEAFKEFGMIAFIIRMNDKMNRIKQLYKAGNVVNESMEDTLQDLANYAIIALLELNMKG